MARKAYPSDVSDDEWAFAGDALSLTPAPAAAPPMIMAASVSPVINIEPPQALSAENALGQFVPANSTLWYQFEYYGEHEQVVLTLVGGNENRLRMKIHTPEQMVEWWDTTAIGQGSPKLDDLVWSSQNHDGMMYYVEVINDNPYGVGFDLYVRR